MVVGGIGSVADTLDIAAHWSILDRLPGTQSSGSAPRDGHKTPQRRQTTYTPELTTPQQTPARHNARISRDQALGGDPEVLDGVRLEQRLFQLDEHEVVGHSRIVILWVLYDEAGLPHSAACFLVGLKAVQAQPDSKGAGETGDR